MLFNIDNDLFSEPTERKWFRDNGRIYTGDGIIRLGRVWTKNDSSTDNLCRNTGKQTDHPNTRAIAIVCLLRRTIVDIGSYMTLKTCQSQIEML